MLNVEAQSSVAERTLVRIQVALRENRTVCLARVVELIREVTERPDSVSVQHLAELIEGDVVVVAQVLRVANTIGYNPEGVEVLTVAQAIQVIGFVRIRNLAVSLLLLRHAGLFSKSQEPGEISVLAVVSGQLAEVCAGRLGLVEHGHAFVCVALRGYGELLLSTLFPDEYRNVRQAVANGEGAQAWLGTFGLSPMGLGRRVLEEMGLPQSILSTLTDLPAGSGLKGLSDRQLGLVVATDFAMRVAAWLSGEPGSGVTLEDVSGGLVQCYGGLLDLRKGDMLEIVKEVDRRLSALGRPLGELPLLERVRAAAKGVRLSPLRKQKRTCSDGLPLSSTAEVTRRPASVQNPDPAKVLMEGIAELSDLLAEGANGSDDVLRVGARRMMEAMDLTDCWVFRRQGETEGLVPHWGGGPLFPLLPARSQISLQGRSVFSLSIQRAEAVFLPRPGDPKIRSFVPEWLRDVVGELPLVILPIGRGSEINALLCGVGRRSMREGDLQVDVRQQLKVMAKLMALAGGA